MADQTISAPPGASAPNDERRPRGWLWWPFSLACVVLAIGAFAQGAIISGIGSSLAAALAAPPVLRAALARRPRGAPAWLVCAAPYVTLLIAILFIQPPGAEGVATANQSQPTAEATGAPPANISGHLSIALDEARMFVRDDIQADPNLAQDYSGAARGTALATHARWVDAVFAAKKQETLAEADAKSLAALEREAAIYQGRDFPRLREGLGRELAQRLFRQNIEVTVAGKARDQVILTGPLFFNNANIADVQAMLEPQLRPFRFRAVAYRAYDGARTWTYPLKAPADQELGRLIGEQFYSASKPTDLEASMKMDSPRWAK